MSKPKNLRKTWNDYEQNFLQENLNTMSVRDIAKHLGRSESSVSVQATKQRYQEYSNHVKDAPQREERNIVEYGKWWEEGMINGNLYKPEDLTGEELEMFNNLNK